MNQIIEYTKDDDVHFILKIVYVMYFIFFVQFSVMLCNTYYKIPNSIFNEDMYDDEDSDDEDSDDEDSDDDEDEEKEKEKEKEPKKIELPYEKKYLDKLLSLSLDMKKWTEEDLDHLHNTYIIENTPRGNVLMYWNNKNKSFTYYADATIPYRYLEVVSRKYVVINNCRQIYIIKREKNEESKREKDVNVFAKFKKYNQSSIHMVKAMNPPSLSSSSLPPPISMTRLNKNNSNETIDNDEMFNRYLCDGRMANFSFLKKEKKEGRKITFSEFKKMKSS